MVTQETGLWGWDEVIEQSFRGIRPDQLTEIIKMQWQITRRLHEKQGKHTGK